MDIRQLSPRYSVSPMLVPEDVQAIRDAGFAAIICNRPDSEVDPFQQAEAMRAAAENVGIAFEVLPLTHQTMNAENVARQAAMVEEANGPVLAYCASGTRCSVIWALGQASVQPVDDILARTTAAGYQLDGLRPRLEEIAQATG